MTQAEWQKLRERLASSKFRSRFHLRETELRAFPLFCPKCRRESIISVKNFIMETQEARR